MDSTKSVGVFMLYRLKGLSFEENDHLAYILEKNCTAVIAISKINISPSCETEMNSSPTSTMHHHPETHDLTGP